MIQPQTTSANPVVLDMHSLNQVLEQEFKPRSEVSKHLVESAIQVLAHEALRNQSLVQDSVIETIQSVIAGIDAILTNQLNAIIHQDDFQKLEGSWRGLHYLVNNSQTSSTLKVRVMNISKKELQSSLRNYRGTTWDQSPLFKRVYEEEFGQFGGEPFGCIIGDYTFDHSSNDVELLRSISKVAASAHSPFIAAAAPSMMQMDKWSEIANPVDIEKIFSTPEYAAWNALRQSPDSRYVALTLPRFAARAPYGERHNRVEGLAFEEFLTRGADDVVWSNAAYAMGVNINRAFSNYGWCSQIRGVESGGIVTNLPILQFAASDHTETMGVPTEATISDRREAELSQAGFMPLIYRKNSDIAAFIGARTIHATKKYEVDSANENAEISTRLPYIFAVSRFAHYLKCIARDKVGGFKSRTDVQRWLNDWVMRYVDGNPSISSDEVKARRPLAAAEVVVEEIAGEIGYYNTTFYLRPHYQLEGLSVSLRLVGRIPSSKASA